MDQAEPASRLRWNRVTRQPEPMWSRVRRNHTVRRWGGQDSNLRPRDYESPALTD